MALVAAVDLPAVILDLAVLAVLTTISTLEIVWQVITEPSVLSLVVFLYEERATAAQVLTGLAMLSGFVWVQSEIVSRVAAWARPHLATRLEQTGQWLISRAQSMRNRR